MKYSPKQFYLDFPEGKRKKDTLICRFLIRPLSFLFSSFFTLLGIGANAVSIISLFFSISSCGLLIAFYFTNLSLFFYLSIASFFVWAVLDCVDGNIARSIKKEKYGDFLDAVAGYIFPGIFFALVGICSCKTENILFTNNNDLILIISVVASTSIITLLLSNKKFEENKKMYENDNETSKPRHASFVISIVKRLWSEISFGGFMPIFLLLAYIFKLLNLFVFVYSMCFLSIFVLGMFFLILNSIKSNHRIE